MVKPKPNTRRKWREVRDVYNKLSKKYRSDNVVQFIKLNYFMDVGSIYFALQNTDTKPVETPSLTYQNVMRDDFHL